MEKQKFFRTKASYFICLFYTFAASLLFADQLPKGFGVNFFDSMKSIIGEEVNKLTSSEWKAAEALYERYIIKDRQYSETPRIPKIIHQIWLGSPLPEKYKALQKTWLDHHPDWEYRLWTDKEVNEFGLLNRALYDADAHIGHKVDIVKAEIMYRIGGLYVDTDFECLAPYDIFHHCLDFYIGTNYFSGFSVYYGIVGAAPKHPIFKDCIETYELKQYHADPAVNILYTVGPYHLTKSFKKIAFDPNNTSRIVAFPSGYFYPWPWSKRDQKERSEIEKWIRPETFGIHHWHVSWNNGVPPGQKKAQPKNDL